MKDGTHGTHADTVDGPLLLSAKNIKDGTIRWDESDRRISQDEYEKIHSKFSLKKGDVLLTIVGSIGETAILKDPEGITFQRSVAFLRPNEYISSDFLYAKIQTPAFQKDLESRKSTSAQPGIYLGDLAEIPVEYAPSLEEQIKIGEYFWQLDHLITLHQRKCDETKKLKKYMLQKMFPQNGEKVPEIRFSGFTDDWEQRKLSQVVDSIDTGKSKYNVLENGEYEILGSTGTIGYDNSYDYDGDFLLTARVGANAGTLYRHHGKVKITDNTVFLQGNQIDFIYYLLDRFDLKRLSFGSGQPLIKASELKNLELQMPITKEEKDKIANYFVCIDHLITLHQRELENLQNIKKFMLEKMFV